MTVRPPSNPELEEILKFRPPIGDPPIWIWLLVNDPERMRAVARTVIAYEQTAMTAQINVLQAREKAFADLAKIVGV